MTDNLPTVLGLPKSNALAEADPHESISDLMSRDPEGFTKQDLSRVVEVLRAQRVKFEKAEAEGKTRGVRQQKIGQAKSLETSKSLEDLGL